MNGDVTEGPLFDAALTTLALHELDLDNLEWNELSRSMRIDVHKDFKTGTVGITVHGLPPDIPVDVFEDLLDNAIKFTIESNKAAMVKPTTRNWVIHYKRRVLA